MPMGDRRGPSGKGSRTGRAGGLCSDQEVSRFRNRSQGRGMGRGMRNSELALLRKEVQQLSRRLDLLSSGE